MPNLDMLTEDDVTMIVFEAVSKSAEGLIAGFGFCETDERPLNELQKIQMTIAYTLAMNDLRQALEVQIRGTAKMKDFYSAAP